MKAPCRRAMTCARGSASWCRARAEADTETRERARRARLLAILRTDMCRARRQNAITADKPKVTSMAFSSWRGVVGMINPTMRPGVTEEVIRLLPEGIGLIPLFLNIRRGTEDEFEAMMPAYEKQISVLADCGCDLIHPHGAPPFMVQGRKREAEIVRRWERKYRTPIMTVAQNHVNALTALHVKTMVGATYFPPKLNAIFARYFRDAGFKVRAMEGIDVPFDKVQELSSQQIYAHIKRSFLKAKGADAIYMLGSGWRTLDIIETLERDLQVPVVHPVTARVWEIQKRLHVREPRQGFGHLLAALP